MNKIGLGIVTCNRADFFKKVIDKIDVKSLHSVVTVNDGNPYNQEIYPDNVHVIQHEKNTCVGVSKNDAIKYLMSQNCDHIFLMEDDILIKDHSVFEKYIKLSELSQVKHFNFGYHGPANLRDGIPNPKYIVEGYDPEGKLKMAVNHHCVGAFSYYARQVIETCGLMDEVFKNAWEHVEHTVRIIKAKFHPNFWNFCDLENSYVLLGEIASSEVNSTIRKTPEWNANMMMGRQYFAKKHGIDVLKIQDVHRNEVHKNLKLIKEAPTKK